MFIISLIFRFAVVGVAVVAALVGVLVALIASAFASGDTHLYVIDDDEVDGGLDDLDALLDEAVRTP